VLGQPLPIGVCVDCFGTNLMPVAQIHNSILRTFDLSVNGIIEALDLQRPSYSAVSAYGHFGQAWPTWEQTNKTKDLWSNL
jgi:S-adenosylmethionine synthetase